MSNRKTSGRTGSPAAASARDRARAEEQAAQRRRERRILALVAIGVVLLLVAGGIGFQAWRANRQPTAAPGAGVTSAPVELRTGQPVVFGSTDAAVELTLYSDFHCPHCAEFEESYGPALADAQARGVANQRIFPMAFIDEGSASSANAFGCAAQAGFAQAYFDGLFANHTLAWSDDQLLDLAEQVTGSVPPDFRTCVTGRSNAAWVESINAAANSAGVTSTPTLFVDQTRIDLAAVTPDGLRTLIDEAAQQ